METTDNRPPWIKLREGLASQGYQLTEEQFEEVRANIEEYLNDADSHSLIVISIGDKKHLYSPQAKLWLHRAGHWATFPEGHEEVS